MQDRNFYPLLVSILDYFQAIKSVETVTHLKKIFKSQDAGEMILKSVIEVLESYKDPASVNSSFESLDNTFETVRLAAVKALGTLKDSKAITFSKNITSERKNVSSANFTSILCLKYPTPKRWTRCAVWREGNRREAQETFESSD
jgi:HEAT repeat protein